jgi:hypothetical protein
MILNIYTVHDAKASAFLVPFFSANDLTAIRQIGMSCRDPGSMFHAFPEDYTLYYLGTFDDQTSEIEKVVPKAMINLIDVKEKQGA